MKLRQRATLDTLVDVIADLVAQRLEQRSHAPAEPDVYTSKVLPPDVTSRRAFHERARRLPGATKVGRTWRVPRAVWEARTSVPKDVSPNVAELAAQALAEWSSPRSFRRG